MIHCGKITPDWETQVFFKIERHPISVPILSIFFATARDRMRGDRSIAIALWL
ncbi:hypothetical protein [Spirulina sp. 06S082]|uniref:hypothetical protein n=1 Tax=Spirulina sp. 06S082 TaxID=3110248 RepID=UPI002B1EFF97|nr:hypothetical protein [Spirulina sp. 06S082]MEA5467525.1 hypothetical protein [Spirulina sp. 06S082]